MDLLGSELHEKFAQLRQVAALLREAQFAPSNMRSAMSASVSTAAYSGGGLRLGGGGTAAAADDAGSPHHYSARSRDGVDGAVAPSFVPYVQRVPAHLTTASSASAGGPLPSQALFPSLKHLGGSSSVSSPLTAGGRTTCVTGALSSASSPMLDATTRVHDAAVVFHLTQNPLHLSKQPAEPATLLRLHSLGDALQELLREVEAGVQGSLLEFYRHLADRQAVEARVLPQKTTPPPPLSGAGGGEAAEGARGPLVRILPTASCVATAGGAEEGGAFSTLTGGGGGMNSRPLPLAASSVVAGGGGGGAAAATTTTGANAATTLGGSAQQADRRLAAGQLQYTIHMLLEAALTGTDSTTAALYMTDACRGTTNPNNATTTTGGGASVATRPTTSSGNKNPRGSPGPAAAPRFLHRVAHFDADDRLPAQVSCVAHHPLVLVAQSGVAVNLARVQRERGPAAAAATTAATADDPHGSSYAAYWDVRNAVVIPLAANSGWQQPSQSQPQDGGALQGCLVLADKRLSLLPRAEQRGANKGFTVEDEHLAWGTARLLHALLQRYDPQLLLDFHFSSGLKMGGSGAAALSRCMRFNPIPTQRAMLLSSAAARSAGSPTRGGDKGDGEAMRFTSKAAQKVYALMERAAMGAPEEFPDGDDLPLHTAAPLLNARLRIVRGGDQAAEALRLRAQLVASAAGAAGEPPAPTATEGFSLATPAAAAAPTPTATGGSALLREEDVFESAAHYVRELETLWQGSLQGQTRLADLVAGYEAQLEEKRATITALEVKLRGLTAAAAAAAAAGMASSPSAASPSGGTACALGKKHKKKTVHQ